MITKQVLSTAVMAGSMVFAGAAQAATISWGLESGVTGAASDITVDDFGTVIQAVSYGTAGANQTVAGIDFAFVGTAGLTLVGGGVAPDSGNFGAGVFWTNTTDDLAPILLGQAYGGSSAIAGSGMSFELTGLTSRNAYQVQLFVADVRAGFVRNLDVDGNLATEEIADFTGGVTIVGSFTADGATQTVSVLKPTNPTGSQGQIGAFVVSEVPEPGSLALLALGGLMIARRRRG